MGLGRRIVFAASAALVAGLTGGLSLAQDAVVAAPMESGQLAAGDLILGKGQYYDPYNVQANVGQTIHVEMVSADFIPAVLFLGPNNEQQAFKGEKAAGGNRLVADFPVIADGFWTVNLSQVDSAVGDYTFSVTVVGP